METRVATLACTRLCPGIVTAGRLDHCMTSSTITFQTFVCMVKSVTLSSHYLGSLVNDVLTASELDLHDCIWYEVAMAEQAEPLYESSLDPPAELDLDAESTPGKDSEVAPQIKDQTRWKFSRLCATIAERLVAVYEGANTQCAEAVSELLKEHGNKNAISSPLNLHGNQMSMKSNRIDDGILIALFTACQGCYLSGKICFAYNNITDEGAVFVAEILRDPTDLLELDFTFNSIRLPGAAALYEALKVNSSLRTLRMGHNEIGDDGGLLLAQLLQISDTLVSIDVDCTNLEFDGLRIILIAMKSNVAVEYINLGRPVLTLHDGPATLPKHIQGMMESTKKLKCLRLPQWQLSDFDLQQMLRGMVLNTTLVHLDLTGNKIGPDGAQHLAEYLSQNVSLRTLNLDSNRLQDEGAQILSNTLMYHNSTIRWLNIQWNNIKRLGLCAVAKAIRNSASLTHIYVWGNHFDPVSSEAFTVVVSGAIRRISDGGAIDVGTDVVDGVTQITHVKRDLDQGPYPHKYYVV